MAPTFHGRILVADDNPVNRMAVSALLQRLGLQVENVSSGEEALAAIEKDSFCLCLLDLNMPSMNGIDTSREIRRREEKEGRERLPIVAISGDLEEEAKDTCMAAGMDGWLGKPFKLQQVCEFLEKYAEGKGSSSGEPGGKSAEAGREQKGANGPRTLNAERVRELRDLQGSGGADHFTELVGIYLPSSGRILGDLRRACERGDAASLAAMAHELKSCTLNMGGERLASLCRDLEVRAGRNVTEGADRLVRAIEAELSRLQAALTGELQNRNAGEEEER